MRLMVICICMVPRRLVCGGFPVPLLVVVCRALPLAWSPPPRSFYNISMDSNRYIYIRRNTLEYFLMRSGAHKYAQRRGAVAAEGARGAV